jgi:hypothetical protein
MAMLATLEGIENNRGTFLGACLGACEMVASTVRGCLGAINTIYDLKVDTEMDSILNPYERDIAKDFTAGQALRAGRVPQAGWIGKTSSGEKSWNYVGRENISLGLDPGREVKAWFYPVQTFLLVYEELYRLYPDINAEERAAIAYFNWLAKYAEPTTQPDAAIYQLKVATIKEFLNGLGYSSAWKKVEAEQSRGGQAAAAAAAASGAAAAYKAAMEKKAAEAAAIEAQATAAQEEIIKTVNKEKAPETENGSGSSILPILGIAAAAALAFMG